jgi:hypothetical protein
LDHIIDQCTKQPTKTRRADSAPDSAI